MRALYYRKNGGTDTIEDGPWTRPNLTRDTVRIKVEAIGLNPLDYRMRRGEMTPFGRFFLPHLLTSDFSGVVLEKGDRVDPYKAGDRVYGMAHQVRSGSSADEIVVSPSIIALAPRNLNPDVSATVPLAALTALQALRDLAHVQAGERILINGASGGVGTFAAQLARHWGLEVTAVTSHRNADWMAEIGATHVIDYTQQDWTQGDARYDVIFDAYGNRPFGRAKSALTPQGRHVSTIPSPPNYAATLSNPFRRQKTSVVTVRAKHVDLEYLRARIEEGAIVPKVERVFERDEVQAAYKHLESKRTKGKLAVRMVRG